MYVGGVCCCCCWQHLSASPGLWRGDDVEDMTAHTQSNRAVLASADQVGSSSVTAKGSDSSAASVPDPPFVLWCNPGLNSTVTLPTSPLLLSSHDPSEPGCMTGTAAQPPPESCWPVPPPACNLCHPQTPLALQNSPPSPKVLPVIRQMLKGMIFIRPSHPWFETFSFPPWTWATINEVKPNTT